MAKKMRGGPKPSGSVVHLLCVSVAAPPDVPADDVRRSINTLLDVGYAEAMESIEEDEDGGGHHADADLLALMRISEPTAIEPIWRVVSADVLRRIRDLLRSSVLRSTPFSHDAREAAKLLTAEIGDKYDETTGKAL